ncbi:hypothetical protein [Oryzifoliimicrobium ureilyticus]|uniref:hypothetical protein n=1 Tax=Oryzifoliimicrobium ureilyticus TaxID=3113724 RepID=UPI003076814D
MADFIAVIRRAVDGLAENTPEMRAKVYERARSAVQRQLENMKPRPPEAMLQRQLEKLEAAIREVDSEYAEALPAEEAPVTETSIPPLAEVPQEPAPTPVEAYDAPREEPAAPTTPEPEPITPAPPAFLTPAEAPQNLPEPELEPVAYSQPSFADEPVSPVEPEVSHPAAEQPVGEPVPGEAPEVLYAAPEHDVLPQHEEPVPVVPPQVEPEPEPVAPEPQQPAVQPAAPPRPVGEKTMLDEIEEIEALWRDTPAPAARTIPAPPAAPSPTEPPAWLPADPTPVHAEPTAEEQPVFAAPEEPQHPAEERHGQHEVQPQVAAFTPPPEAEVPGHFEPVWNEPVATPEPVQPPAHAIKGEAMDWAEEELRLLSGVIEPSAPGRAASKPVDEAPKLEVAPAASPQAKKMPTTEAFSWEAAAFDDLPPIDSTRKSAAPAHFQDDDILSDIRDATEPGAGWSEASALRDYDRRGVVAEEDGDGDGRDDLESLVASKGQNRAIRVEPKRKKRIVPILVLLLLVVVVAGGGYAAWVKREQVTAMLTGLVRSIPTRTDSETTPPATTTPPASQDASSGNSQPASNTPQPAATTDGGNSSNSAQPSTQHDPSLVDNKFTQRLMSDGTEIDSGPGTVSNPPTAEGKSVAERTVASADQAPQRADTAGSGAPTATASTPAQAQAANAAPPAADQAASNVPPAGAERLFLYEEVVGQPSPTAIPGSVTWSVQSEAGENGRQEPTIQASISVPGRELTALVTFKRNSDPEFKASHMIEVVFSLPKTFEGGGVDSVQRISMKTTEQDRGEALNTGWAKITDDYYMLALNAEPDAKARNLSLLASRDWIDLPIVYRNGRRALLTFQKGASGKQAFDTVMPQWQAMGDAVRSQ